MTKNWRLKIITLWFGQAISILTSSIVSMCIVWYLTIQTGSAAILTTAVIITYLPQAFLSLFAGVLIDRFNKKYIIILSDLFLALTSVVLAYLFYTKEITLGILLFMLSLRGIGSALHSPTTKALTPLLVPKEHLVAYSGYSQVFSTISNIVSPAIALTLNSLFPLHTIVLIDAFGALLAVLLFLPIAVPYVKKNVRKAPHHQGFYGWVSRTKKHQRHDVLVRGRGFVLPDLCADWHAVSPHFHGVFWGRYRHGGID